MEISSHSMTGSHHRPSIGWFHRCSTSTHYSHSMDCTSSTLSAIDIMGVSLALVNGSYHCPVIKWFSNMFDFNTSIHMLEFVLWSDGVGAQDAGIWSQKSRLRGVMSHSWLYTWFFRQMAMTIPWVILFWSSLYGWLRPYCGSISYDPFIQMAASMPRIHSHDHFLDGYLCLYHGFMYFQQRFQLCICIHAWFVGLPTAASGSLHLLVKHFTPHICSDFIL